MRLFFKFSLKGVIGKILDFGWQRPEIQIQGVPKHAFVY